ncbi:hypothetical protein CEY11_06590 [Candidimonas nitroreducens]|uniref:Tripartite tricarboxylate transporter substrate binding protein n=2 Tax=Candidimonas nitroreducens TaxID=683354 RepID=A0A225MSD3_9BURK|nr:hypothetical protein CEY11_06590 [Candidimonas nitroreducens]
MLAAMASLPLAAQAAANNSWQPRRPIEMLISYPAGGGADTIGRALAAQVGRQAGWKIIPMNKPGAGGLVFLRDLSEAKPDGSRIGICLSSQLTFPPGGSKSLAVNIDDYVLLGSVATSYMTILSKGGGPLASIDAIKSYAKKNGSVSIAVSPTFSWLSHALSDALGVTVIGVVYKGASEYLPALLGGHVDLVVWAGGTQQLEAAGTVVVVATLASQRIPGDPSIPTLKENGIPIEVEADFIVLAPKAMDTGITETFTGVIAKAAQSPAFQSRMEALLGRPARYVAPQQLFPHLKAQQQVALEYESRYAKH